MGLRRSKYKAAVAHKVASASKMLMAMGSNGFAMLYEMSADGNASCVCVTASAASGKVTTTVTPDASD